ncbi:hypothetical protein TGRUB_269720 [Toxoplasma gondii RUB]|uniref:Uncharacterized protein n=4 Tax=Toxoplasma gondii TaxID=5811 RepID=V4ZS19_TOXGV|nr:hypothetical protein TGVEG_269720 [Toxoplasma gondii VEG]KFG52347.1 hypothetical protein TGP89_269720 [Toxoplasma gondii p89]KFG61530.1 hypothetical protein TGRUB_269720 [Toxoplasma gondii RUB]PUA87799.1 hypothetical protein TGBR9_269720 [Toxoplasma gondii TgCATBr9]CEL75380.1 TPA: hypothetical protein BN1205_016950 [Toxoplasma gondii VEG]
MTAPTLQANTAKWTGQRAARLRSFIVSLISQHKLADAPECRSFVRATGNTHGSQRGHHQERRWFSWSDCHASPITSSSAGVPSSRHGLCHSPGAKTESEPTFDQAEHAFSVSAKCALKRISQVAFGPRYQLSRQNSVGRVLACLAALGMTDDARYLLDVCVGRTRATQVELKNTNDVVSVNVAEMNRGGNSARRRSDDVEAPGRCSEARDSEIVGTLIEECPLGTFADLVSTFASLGLINPKSVEALKRRVKQEEHTFSARTLTYLSLSAKELPSPLDAEFLESLCPAISSCLSRHPEAFTPRLIARFANACARHCSSAQIQGILDLLERRMVDTVHEFDAASLVLALCEFGKTNTTKKLSLFSACLPRLHAMVPFLTPVDTVMLLATLENFCWKSSGASPVWPASGPIRELAHAVLRRLRDEGTASFQSDARSICRLLDILSRMPQDPVEGAVFDAVCTAVGTVEKKKFTERQVVEIMNACSRVQRMPPLSLIWTVFTAGQRLLFKCDPKYVALFWHALPGFLNVASLELKPPGTGAACRSSSDGIDEELYDGVRWKEDARWPLRTRPHLETQAASTDSRFVAGSQAQATSDHNEWHIEQAEQERTSHLPGKRGGYVCLPPAGDTSRGGNTGFSRTQSSRLSSDVPAVATHLLSELCNHLGGRETPQQIKGSRAGMEGEFASGSWSAMQPRDMAMILNAMSRMELVHHRALYAADADLQQRGRITSFTIQELTLTLNAFSRLRFQLSPYTSNAISERLEHFVRCLNAGHSSRRKTAVHGEENLCLTYQQQAPVGLLCCLANSLVKLESPVCQTYGFLGILELIVGMCSDGAPDEPLGDRHQHKGGFLLRDGETTNHREIPTSQATQLMSSSKQESSSDAPGSVLRFLQCTDQPHYAEHEVRDTNLDNSHFTEERVQQTPEKVDDGVRWSATARNLSLALFATTFWSYVSRTSLAVPSRERERSKLDAPLLLQVVNAVASAARNEGWRLDNPARRQCLMSALALWTMWTDERALSLRLQSRVNHPFLKCAHIIVSMLDMNCETTNPSDCRSSTVQEEVYCAMHGLMMQHVVPRDYLLKTEHQVLLYTVDLLLIRDVRGGSGEVPGQDERSTGCSSTIISLSETTLQRANDSYTKRVNAT